MTSDQTFIRPGRRHVTNPVRPHAILVIANRTCPCPTLVDEVARRAIDPPAGGLVVAPA